MRTFPSFLTAILVGLASPMAHAQQVTPQENQFETAAIHPVQMTPGCFRKLPPGGTHYRLTCISLRDLIAIAWRVDPDNIQGSTGNAMGEVYELNATTPGDKPWTDESVRPMMRQLLEERFHLAVHSGTRQVSGYALVVAKDGPKLEPAAQGQETGDIPHVLPGAIRGRGVPLSTVAALLSAVVRETVEDRTGLSGIYNIDLHFAPLDGSDSDFPSFFTALEKQLGLKLQPVKLTIPTLVVESVDTSPTPN